MEIGEEIRYWRGMAGLSVAGLSEKIGVPRQTLINWERGDRKPPEWACGLILSRLPEITAGELEKRAGEGDFCEDKNGELPEIGWCVIGASVTRYASMRQAICWKEPGEQLACCLFHKGSSRIFTDKNGNRADPVIAEV